MLTRSGGSTGDFEVRTRMDTHINGIYILSIEECAVVCVGIGTKPSSLFVCRCFVDVCDCDDVRASCRFLVIGRVEIAKNATTSDNANFNFLHQILLLPATFLLRHTACAYYF